jgi:PTH1 family peptidyl-tRNA hydrolase
MKLVVGLGNPGRKYVNTRHNVGFEVIELLQRRWKLDQSKQQFQALTDECQQSNERVMLLRPQTFMNLSGASVLAARDFYKIPHEQILVLTDDFALPLGKLRIRPQGTAGGQKGLADIIKRLGAEQIPRLRIGVGPLPPGWNAADFVLGKFTAAEQPEIDIQIERAADAVEHWIAKDLATMMAKFNPSMPSP